MQQAETRGRALLKQCPLDLHASIAMPSSWLTLKELQSAGFDSVPRQAAGVLTLCFVPEWLTFTSRTGTTPAQTGDGTGTRHWQLSPKLQQEATAAPLVCEE